MKNEGPKGLISRKIGAPSNHRASSEKIVKILAFCNHEDHHDFGPTLTQEYLRNRVSIFRSVLFVE